MTVEHGEPSVVLDRARATADAGAIVEAVEIVEREIARVEASEPDPSAELYNLWCGYADLLRRAGVQGTDTRQLLAQERILTAAIEVFGSMSHEATKARRGLAAHLRTSGEHSRAAELMRLVITYTECERRSGRGLAGDMKEYAYALLESGNFESARETFDRARAAAQGLKGEASLCALIDAGSAQALLALGRHQEAVPFARAASDRLRDRYGDRNRHVAKMLELLEVAKRGR